MAKTRQLLLLRHAKSSWDDAAFADFDRPLAQRGEKSAPMMGAEIAGRGWLPDLVLVSPALRTLQTWQLASAAWPRPLPPADFPHGLYEASADAVLAEAQAAPASVRTLLVVGHNPGLEDFARELAGHGSDGQALRSMTEKFPTAALARFEFEGAWDGLQFGSARLTHFLKPRDLG
ncbi:histidine phosphatase [Aminobacter sp. DSM 101952]|uniref:SixA phosphatase family protein n=1 Tax=Aminobacter sp. DSM 101952 TaxID=2735891 RepID=UPI0006FE9407|nr:histidine phosphatase family protein [Aminobacter sp. DSM 101952]KQU65737.1 histidine phosphatase [Aminobacter sp. DSM 101952]